MGGQGGPNRTWGIATWVASSRRVGLLFLLFFASWASFNGQAWATQPGSLRRMVFRITWWGKTPGNWCGVILLSQGKISDFLPLSLEPDASTSAWIPPGLSADVHSMQPPEGLSSPSSCLLFRPESPRRVDGVEISVESPLESLLGIGFRTTGPTPHYIWLTNTLSNMVEQPQEHVVEALGLVVRIQRRADDRLRVRVDRDSLVFRPGESFRFELQPDLSFKQREGTVRLDLRLSNTQTGRDEWHQQLELAPATESLPISLRLPTEEGVYDLSITAEAAPKLPLPHFRGLPSLTTRPPLPALPEPLWSKAPLAQRKIQLVVVSDQEAAESSGASSWRQVAYWDPGATRWRERFGPLPQPQRLLPITRSVIASKGVRVVRQGEQVWSELAPSVPQEPSYFTVSLPVDKPGATHLLELELPPGFPQLLAVGVLEATGSDGALWPSAFSAVVVPQQVWAFAEAPTSRRHHLFFWPRSKEPVLLLMNLSPNGPARWGRISVHSTSGKLAPLAPKRTVSSQRMLTAYAARPFAPEMFGGGQKTLAGSLDAADDWPSFYDAAVRLIDYVRYVGYNSVSFPVYAEGSSLYPSSVLRPNCRYDTGLFNDTGQDPVRKDVVELVARLCDRTGLGFIPALEFAAPLPRLEELLRTSPQASSGVVLEGTSLSLTRGTAKLPRYNPIHPQVQAAIEEAVEELLNRYSAHACFIGVALQLTPETFTHFPGLAWPLDDLTLQQFREESGVAIDLSETDPTQRAVIIAHQFRQQWLVWRARKLTKFYIQLGKKIAAHKPQATLFLVGPEIFDVPELRDWLRPRLPQHLTAADAYLLVGLDISALAEQDNVVILRPYTSFIFPEEGGEIRSCDLNFLPYYDRLFSACRKKGTVIFRRPVAFRLPAVEELSQRFATSVQLATWHIAGDESCRPLAQSLASVDPEVIFDGTWHFSLGHGDTFRQWLAGLKHLPPAATRGETGRSDDTFSPVVIRLHRSDRATYLSVVNPTDVPVEVKFRLGPGAQLPARVLPEGLAYSLLPGSPGPLVVLGLKPFGCGILEFSSAGVELQGAELAWPTGMREQLAAEIHRLSTALAVLRNPPLWPALQNPGFEMSAEANTVPPGWLLVGPPEATLQPDEIIKRSGNYSLRLRSPKPGATLVSHPFDPPPTGRLTVRLHWRPAQYGPRIRLSVEGKTLWNEVLVLGETVTMPPGAETRASQQADFHFVDLELSDIPVGDLQAIRLRVDLLDPGEVWFDDVLLTQLAFNRVELVELMKLVAPAEAQIAQGRYAEALRLLESPWARFLKRHVPLGVPSEAEPPLAVVADSPNPPAPPPESTSANPLSRLWEWIPRRLRLF